MHQSPPCHNIPHAVHAQTEPHVSMKPSERWHLGRKEMELILEERDCEYEAMDRFYDFILNDLSLQEGI